MKKGTLFLVWIWSITGAWAQTQESLNLEKALELGLENNLQIKIGVENQSLRSLDKKIAAGNFFMPTLNANYLRSFSTEDVTQTFVSDPENPREIDAAKSRNKAYSFVGIYGFRPESLVTMRRLGLLEEISELEAKIIVENTIAGISTAYYRLILELQRFKVLEQTLALSKARLEIAQAQYELGGAGKRDFLAAQVDYNGDSSLLMTQYQVIQNARVNLNELLATDPSTDYLIQDSTISIGKTLSLDELVENAFLDNKLLLANQRRNNDAFLQLKELQAQRLPALNLNSSFNNSVFNSDAGFLIQNERQGLNYGGSITFNLFSGLTLNRRIQSAKVNQRIQDYSLEQFEIQLKSDLQRAYNTYDNNLGLLSIEQKNYQVAKENSEIALERFRLGIASYLEFRDAQVNLLSAENRLITSVYQIKEQEIELLRLSGNLFFTTSLEEETN
ncbi:MAG: TolC family protein [Algoriphagus sp.]|jgi:outer membrane protein|uniref:TolC family protein n=1 Tax=Algoriphagus sp. TaxID=1872435 RepID=UPI00277617E9|nr:TolC family protein [Algoriphagus sp.]MDP4747122.1 TolC family protein [Algoriphagus sp.]MDP4838671.1 TolC family protein [Algoriphagus sp.]MDP4904115.1 TolC family protein [Algoriphagus sp.]MDP4957665.1 TolC family protein [Algoriphagus sp.]